MKKSIGRIAASALACAGLFVGLVTNADAKAAWEAHAGGEAYDAAKGGIAQTPDGGFITVGEASSFSRRGDYDVYVIKNDICGSFQWAATYNIGGNDYGRRIRVTPDGGYIITGQTENTQNCCTRDDAFLMKLKEDGQVEWTKTFGGKGDDQGADVELYYNGEKGYLVAGRTNSFGAGNYDAWLIGTDLSGSMLWSRVYGGANDDGFNGLTQTLNGDIVSTGDTKSYGRNDPANPTSDLYLVRTNDQGDVNAGWSYHYGGGGDEVGYEVIEAPKDFGTDELIICGKSTTYTPKHDAYLLRVKASGGTIRDHLYGSGNGDDEFRDLVSVPWSDDIYAVGRTFKPENGFGGFDVFTVRVDVNLKFGANCWVFVHGGKDNDEGYGIAADFQQGGFGWAGSTFSFTFGKEDVYMGLAFPFGEDFCHDAKFKPHEFEPGFDAQDAPTNQPLVSVECNAKVGAVYNDWYKIICSTCFGGGGDLEGGNGDLSQQRVPLRGSEGGVVRTALTAEQVAASAR